MYGLCHHVMSVFLPTGVCVWSAPPYVCFLPYRCLCVVCATICLFSSLQVFVCCLCHHLMSVFSLQVSVCGLYHCLMSVSLCTGVCVWPLPPLVVHGGKGLAAYPPHGHRRLGDQLRPLPQRQLPQGLPLLQQTGQCSRRACTASVVHG